MKNNFFLEDNRLKNETQFEASPHLLPNILKFLNQKDTKSLGLSCCSLYNRIRTNPLNQLRYQCPDIFKKIAATNGVLEKIPFLNKEYSKLIYKNILRNESIALFKKQMCDKIGYLFPELNLYDTSEVIEKMAELDIAQAIVLANSLFDPHYRIFSFLCIAHKDLKLLNQIYPMVDLLDDDYWKSRALSKIAKLEAKFDIKQARATAHLINQDMSDELPKALMEIAKVEAENNLEKAYATIDTIEGTSNKIHAMTEIVKVIAKNNPEQAISIAKTFSGDDRNIMLYCIITEAGLKIDCVQAHSLADSIRDTYWKDRALCEIAKREVMYDIEQAKKTTDSIISPYYQAESFLMLAQIDPKFLKSAHDLVYCVHDKIRDNIVIELAIKEAQYYGNSRKAFKTIENFIKNDNLKSIMKDRVLVKIIKIQAQTGVRKAFRTLESVNVNFWKAEAYTEIFKARSQIQRRNFQSCKNIIFKAWNSGLSDSLKESILVDCLAFFKDLK